MIQVIRKLIDEIKLIWPFTPTPVTHGVDKFDAIERLHQNKRK